MTLKELLLQVDFDNVVPFTTKHYQYLCHCMAGFKMAFDGMRNTMPNKCEEQIKVEICAEEGEEPYLAVYHSDDDVWENVVGREVIIDSNVKAPLEEIAAAILFDATFYGFTPDDRDDTFEEWDKDMKPPTNGNPYRIRWWKMTQREHDSLCQKKDIGKRGYSIDPKHPFACLTDKPMNRIKRIRAHRWEKRIDELDRLAHRWDLLQKIKSSVAQTDLTIFSDMLFKAPRCKVKRMVDYSADGIGLSYIYELMTKYVQYDFSKADKTLLWVQSPYGIDVEVMERICEVVSNSKALVSSPQIVSKLNDTDINHTRLTIVQLFA